LDLKVDLDDVEKRKFFTIPGLELRPLRRPARSQSLYRLRYPGYFKFYNEMVIPKIDLQHSGLSALLVIIIVVSFSWSSRSPWSVDLRIRSGLKRPVVST
jgi:hypothetical protein